LSDRDKLFLLFVEGPMMGLITDPLATALARGATGQQMFGPQMVTDFLQSMGAYRVSTIVRSGVTIDDKMGGFVIPFIKKGVSPDEIKIMINWAYSFAIYATFTAGGIMESADTDDERAFAWALIAFAGLWPILTQRLQTKYFVPFLFDKFPKQSLLKKLKDPAAHKAIQMVRGEESEILKVLAQQGVEKPGEKLYDYAPKAGRVGEGQVYKLTQKQINKVGHHQSNIRWINFMREGEDKGNPNLAKKRFAMWGIKFGAYAGIAATMITAYFMVRYSTVGKTEKIDGQTVITDIGPLTRMMKAIAAWSKTADPNSPQAMASPDDITEDDVRGMALDMAQILEEERS
jgi:hypothetical protein